MNCYNTQNPTDGQKCTDDILGEVVWNAADGTWQKLDGYTKDGNSWSFNLNSLPGNQTQAQAVVKKYGIWLVAGGVFVLVLVLYSVFSKK